MVTIHDMGWAGDVPAPARRRPFAAGGGGWPRSGRRRSTAHSLFGVHAQVPVDTLRQMIYAHPIFHRGIGDALRDLR
jgi:hypothetical protein